MKHCQNCGNLINENADFCTNCGVRVAKNFEKNTSVKKSSGSWKVVLIICITVIILSIIGIIGYFFITIIDEVKDEINKEQWETKYDQNQITTYDKDQTVIENDMQYTIKNLQISNDINGETSNSKNQFLKITIEMKNLDDEAIGIHPNQFMIENEYGNLYKISDKNFGLDSKFEMMKIKPYETITKILIYEVKQSDKAYYLNVYEEVLDLNAEFRFQLTENDSKNNNIGSTI